MLRYACLCFAMSLAFSDANADSENATACLKEAVMVKLYADQMQNSPQASELTIVRGMELMLGSPGSEFRPDVELGFIELADFAFYHRNNGADGAEQEYIKTCLASGSTMKRVLAK